MEKIASLTVYPPDLTYARYWIVVANLGPRRKMEYHFADLEEVCKFMRELWRK